MKSLLKKTLHPKRKKHIEFLEANINMQKTKRNIQEPKETQGIKRIKRKSTLKNKTYLGECGWS